MGLEVGTIIAITSAVLSAAGGTVGAVMSSRAQKDAARQTEMNAEAQQKALMAERQRKAAELAENQRRMAQQQRRERAAQFSALANTGFVATSGTPLEIMADTMEAQHRDLTDLTSDGQLEQWRLGYQGKSLLEEARSSASLQRAQAGNTLITGIAGAASSAAGTLANANWKPKGSTTGGTTVSVNAPTHKVSDRPPGF